MSRGLASLKWRLVAGMGLGVAATLLVALSVAYWLLREHTLRGGASEQLEQQRIIVAGLDEMFAAVERRTRELAQQLRNADLDADQVAELLRSRVMHNPETASMGVMLEANNPVHAGRLALTVTYGSRGLLVVDMTAIDYDYWNKEWYLKTLASEDGWWSEPYFNDYAGGQDTATFDYPLRRSDGTPFGMVSMSVTLDRVIDVATSLGLVQSPTGTRHVLADGDGRLLMSWDPALERAYDLERAARRAESASLDWLARVEPGAPAQVVRVIDRNHGPERLAYTPLPRMGWRLGTVVPERELLAPLHASIARVAAMAALVLCAALLVFALQARRVAKPLDLLARDTERLGSGEIVAVATVHGVGSEVGRLQSAISGVRNHLQQQKERLLASERSEHLASGRLQLASRTQRELLPADRVFFGPQLQCESAAEVRCSDGVANCSYGFTAPAPGQCVFYLAQVEAEGLEAALLLARLGGMIASLARQSGGPTEMLRRASEYWQGDGDLGRNPQLLVGRLDLDTGHLSLASANHVEPVMLDLDGQVVPVRLDVGPGLDSHARADWPSWHGTLGDQERLLLFSRSVIEAQDRLGRRYGETVLPAAISEQRELPAPALAAALLDGAIAFAPEGSAPGHGMAAMVLVVRERD
ncbi:MAG TPA: SpoIIE family protein phosphatase [Arenimonas sp.]|nr:SpoIIE family protein phosphatase [Arenimonas sp.]